MTQEERDIQDRLRQVIIDYMPDAFSDENMTEEERQILAKTLLIWVRAKAMNGEL
jgi:hypothetical protein